MSTDEPIDLSDAPEEFRDPPPQKIARPAPNLPAVIAPRAEPRGIGSVSAYQKEPVGAVVEILKRGLNQDGKWILYPPFDRSTPKDAKWAFAVMTPTTVTTRMIGTRDSVSRAPHPDFAAFNTCDPEKAQNFSLRLVHFEPARAWKFFLGAYKAPAGRAGFDKGWWCKGDGVTALRRENGKEFTIKCPNRMCEFSQEGSGPRGQGCWCKTHTSLIGQFNWGATSPLPRIMFQWDSQSYHAYENIEAVFRRVKETTDGMNMPNFPVMGLPIRLGVKMTIKGGKRYPEVHASVDGDMLEWIGKIRGSMAQGQLAGPDIVAVRELPPPGMTMDDVDIANLKRLDGRPMNERK